MFVTPAYVGYSYTQDLLSLKRMSVSVAADGVSQLITDCSTPLRVGKWEVALAHHPDQRFASFVVEGLRHGFRIGFGGGFPLVSSPCNMPSAAEQVAAVDKYVEGELAARRFVGPYDPASCPNVHVNRVGAVPKGHIPGKWRIITDLSFPAQGSVNDGIDPALCSLSYVSVDQVAATAAKLGRGAILAKVDIESAYRLVPIDPRDRPLMGIRWKGKIYCDCMLPFGLRSAPKLFTAVADALEWVIRNQGGVTSVAHYLDDFIVLGRPESDECASGLRALMQTCDHLGVPLAQGKSEGPSTTLTFLGIEINTVACTISLPQPKLQRIRVLLLEWDDKKVCTRRELESLVGLLNHACKIVRPGRSFLRRMIDLLSVSKASFARRPFHRIRLNREFRSDLAWWRTFIRDWNGVGYMLGPDSLVRCRVSIATDASGSWGCAAHWGPRWFQLPWDGKSSALPIAVKELVPIIIAAAVWGPEWRHDTVTCRCDNQTVTAALAARSSRNTSMMHLLRCLFFIEAVFEFNLTCVHLPGVENTRADALSRNDVASFRSQVPGADQHPQPLPTQLVEALLNPELDWLSTTWRDLFSSFSGRVWPSQPTAPIAQE